MSKRTPFGTMLSNFRYQKQRAIEKATADLKKRNKADNPKYDEQYEVRESTVHAQDGSTVTRLELWKKIDTERVKISTSVIAQEVKDDPAPQEEDDWLK